MLMQWSGTVLRAGSRVSCSFRSWLRQPCQPQWAFYFSGRLSLWKDESDGKLQESLVCSGIVGCVLPGSLLALAGIGDTLCWVVPKAWYAGESWRRPPLRTRGQGKTIRSTGERTQAKVRTCPVFTVFVPQCCVRLRRRPPSWRASLFALPMATS